VNNSILALNSNVQQQKSSSFGNLGCSLDLSPSSLSCPNLNTHHFASLSPNNFTCGTVVEKTFSDRKTLSVTTVWSRKKGLQFLLGAGFPFGDWIQHMNPKRTSSLLNLFETSTGEIRWSVLPPRSITLALRRPFPEHSTQFHSQVVLHENWLSASVKGTRVLNKKTAIHFEIGTAASVFTESQGFALSVGLIRNLTRETKSSFSLSFSSA